MATTRGTAIVIVPVLTAAFVILYLFPHDTMTLWGWMVCPSMSALIMGAGYLAGAYFFTRAARAKEWHRVGAGFAATTVFTVILLATTVLHWDVFNYDHVSFWAWLLLYGTTPFLLPLLWVKNQRTDPGTPSRSPQGDVTIPRGIRRAAGIGGIVTLVVAGLLFFAPDIAAEFWPWAMDTPTSRSVSAFIAFPAVTWAWFLFDERWSTFRLTQQTATIGLVLIAAATVRARDDFRSDGWWLAYLVLLGTAIALHVALQVAMDRRSRASTHMLVPSGGTSSGSGNPAGDAPPPPSTALTLASVPSV